MKKHLKLEELRVYDTAINIAEDIWRIVEQWNYFHKDTIGKQLIRSVDSIAANIAEGYGRFYYKENRLFCFYARGSLMETKTWITKAHKRGIIKNEEYNSIIEQLTVLHKSLNKYIKSIGNSNDQ